MVKGTWAMAYRALPGAEASKAKRVRDAQSFAEEAFDLEVGFQVSWKAEPEGILDELECGSPPSSISTMSSRKSR